MKEILPSDYDLSEVHLVGNGPSASKFKYTTGTVICFHKPTVNRCDIVCTPAFRAGIEGYWNLPTIITYDINFSEDKRLISYLYSKKSVSAIESKHLCLKWSVYRVYSEHTYNHKLSDSGQRAYIWAIHNGAKKIHLWGFDNIWSTEDDLYITSDPSVFHIFDNERNYVSNKKYLVKRDLWPSILQPNTEIHK